MEVFKIDYETEIATAIGILEQMKHSLLTEEQSDPEVKDYLDRKSKLLREILKLEEI